MDFRKRFGFAGKELASVLPFSHDVVGIVGEYAREARLLHVFESPKQSMSALSYFLATTDREMYFGDANRLQIIRASDDMSSSSATTIRTTRTLDVSCRPANMAFNCFAWPQRPFYQHQWLDVLDRVRNWCEAQVVQVKEYGSIVRMHYKGWKSHYDEDLYTAPDHPDTERIALLHTYTNRETKHPMHLAVGVTLDVMDTQNAWMTGVVTALDDAHHMVRVRYVGWSPRFDEWMHMESHRLAPRHTCTPKEQRPTISDTLVKPNSNTWTCVQCTFLNKVQLTQCEMCQTRRERPVAPSRCSVRLPQKAKPWTCTACTLINVTARKTCEACETPHSTTEAVQVPLPSSGAQHQGQPLNTLIHSTQSIRQRFGHLGAAICDAWFRMDPRALELITEYASDRRSVFTCPLPFTTDSSHPLHVLHVLSSLQLAPRIAFDPVESFTFVTPIKVWPTIKMVLD